MTVKDIYDSYTNGQKKQMAEQIDEMGLSKFLAYLDGIHTELVSTDEKYQILRTYIIHKQEFLT